MREIALDTETTGLDPASGHRIVEIGCVEMMGRVATGNNFHVYLNPERDMPPEAERVHGLSAEFLRDKPLFAEIVENFLLFIGDSPLVIHNAGFDMKFINAELAGVGVEAIPMERTIDTVRMARSKFPGAPASLDALCKRFNIDLSARTLHGALLDAQLLADVYLELMGGRQEHMRLQQTSSSNDFSETAQNTSVAVSSNHFPLRQFPASAEEILQHEAFLEKIKQPIWKKVS